MTLTASVPLDPKAIPDEPQTFGIYWHAHVWTSKPVADGLPRLYVCPPKQLGALQSACTQFSALLELGGAPLANQLDEWQEQAIPFECTVVLKSHWQHGVDDLIHQQFVSLLQRLAKSQCRILRVLTLAAIRCEQAYPRVLHPLDAVYLGLAHAFGKETQSLRVQGYSLAQLDQQHIDAALSCTVENPNGATLAVGHGATWLGTLKQSVLPPGPTPFRVAGVYLIIGGGSGIGAEFAKYLAWNFKATTVLISRSAPRQSLIDELQGLGGTPRHEQADIAEPGALEQVLANYPSIDGVFHSALHLADTAFENMSPPQLQQSLRPKVHGGYRLLEALRQRPQQPRFIIFFSSIQSYIAYPGQANYTAGCLCTDAMADLFESLLCVPTKVINWGYWGSVGVVADDAYRNRMQRLQIGSIEPSHAIPLVERLIVSGTAQLACLRQSPSSLRLRHISPERPVAPSKVPTIAIPPQQELPAVNYSLDTLESQLHAQPMPNEKLNEEAAALDRYARARWQQVQQSNEWTIAPRHARLWQALQHIPGAQSPAAEQFVQQYPRLRSHVALIEQCLAHYPDILSGKKSALEVLFPRGDATLLKNWYADTPTSRLLNVRLAQAILSHANATGNHHLRILELGAGTGATPRVILPIIADYVQEYCFSDVSEAFMKSATEEFGSYPFMCYRKIDVTCLPEDARDFDIIIAANVMHAVSPLGHALHATANALASNGLLLLNETVYRHDVLTLAFGIIEAWWHTDDTAVQRIKDSPLLDLPAWRQALAANGFNQLINYGNDSFQLIIAAVTPQAHDAVSDSADEQAITERLRAIVGAVILLDASELDVHVPLADYGVDSILALQIVEVVSGEYGPQPVELLEQYPTIGALTSYLAVRTPTASPCLASDGETNAIASPDENTVRLIANIVSDVILLPADDIDPDVPLADYGVDSILALSIVEQLSSSFGVQPASLLERHPSIAALALQLSPGAPVPLTTASALPPEAPLSKLVTDHSVGGQRIAPGAYALSWMTQTSGARQLSNVRWHRPMVRLGDAQLDYAEGKFTILDRRSGHLLCSGEYDLSLPPAPAPLKPLPSNTCLLDSTTVYQQFATLGYDYGPLYQGIAIACVGQDQGLSILVNPESCEQALPPALIDSGLQTSILLNLPRASGKTTQMLPTHLGNLCLYALPTPGETVLCHATLVGRSDHGVRFDFNYRRLCGEVLFTLTNMLAVDVSAEQLRSPMTDDIGSRAAQ